MFDDGEDTEERARVFISNSNGTTYLLLSRLNGEGKKTGYIDGVGKGEEALLSSRIDVSFGYYEAFLEYKNISQVISAIWISFEKPIMSCTNKAIT